MSKQEQLQNDDDINHCINEIFDEQEDAQLDQNDQNNTNQEENSYSQSQNNEGQSNLNSNSNSNNDDGEDEEEEEDNKKYYESNDENNLSEHNKDEAEAEKNNTSANANVKQQGYKQQKNTKSESQKKENKKRYSKSRSRSYSKHKEDKYYENCCSKCKKNDKGGKTCICIVPKDSRRSNLGSSGCQTCSCKGCSIDDFINSRKKNSDQYNNSSKNSRDFQMKNGCCKQCLKAFSQTGRACICQVPEKVRKSQLPKSGCKFCGCQGCNPEDTKRHSHDRQMKRSSNANNNNNNNSNNNNNNNNNRDRDRDRNRRRSNSIDDSNNDFNNFDKSNIGIIISHELKMYGPMIGFGIPQRTYSYIIGKPLEKK